MRPTLPVLAVLLLPSCALTDRMALLRHEKACIERIVKGNVPKGCEAHAERYRREEEEAKRAAEDREWRIGVIRGMEAEEVARLKAIKDRQDAQDRLDAARDPIGHCRRVALRRHSDCLVNVNEVPWCDSMLSSRLLICDSYAP